MHLLLHIGLHKTGSSALQHSLANLNSSTHKYLDLGYENQSIPLYTLFSFKPEDYSHWVARGKSVQDVQILKKTFQKRLENGIGKGAETAILSGEDLSVLKPQEIKAMIDTLNGMFESVSVLAYVRHPLELAKSTFSELLKHNNSGTPQEISPRYRQKLEPFLDVLGHDNLHVYDYRACLKEFKTIQSHFAATFGLEKDSLPTQNVANKALTSDAVKYLYMFNTSNPLSDGERRLQKARWKFIRRLESVFLDAEPLKSEHFADVADYSDCEWVHRNFGISYKSSTNEGSVPFQEWLNTITADSQDVLRRHLKDQYGIENQRWSPTQLVNCLWYQILIDHGRRRKKFWSFFRSKS